MKIMNVANLGSCSKDLSSSSDSCASGVNLGEIFGDISNILSGTHFTSFKKV